MKSLKATLVYSLICVMIMATVGYPLGLIPALVVLMIVAFKKAIASVIQVKRQRPLRKVIQPRNLLQENAFRTQQRQQKQYRRQQLRLHLDRIPPAVLATAFGICASSIIHLKVGIDAFGFFFFTIVIGLLSHEVAPYTYTAKSR
jgi:hypothetical protein